MCVQASNHEVFLLSSAALANITFVDTLAFDYFIQYNTAALLIEACHLDKAGSVFAKDQVIVLFQQSECMVLHLEAQLFFPSVKQFIAHFQVATVLANMAGVESCSGHIVENHGVEVLVRFLQEPEPQFGSEAELAACERLHQKSAIALARLCKDEDSCQTVMDLQGCCQLV